MRKTRGTFTTTLERTVHVSVEYTVATEPRSSDAPGGDDIEIETVTDEDGHSLSPTLTSMERQMLEDLAAVDAREADAGGREDAAAMRRGE
jgi:hypothetical protein